MKKELIYKDENSIARYKSRLNETMPLMQAVINKYKDLNIKSELKPNGLTGLLQNLKSRHSANVDIGIVEDFVRGAMANTVKNPSVGGIPIKHEAFKKMIVVPSVDRFAQALERLMPKFGGQPAIWPNCFEMEAGKVIAHKEELERFEAGCTHYAESPGEILLTRKVRKLCDALNDHHEFLDGRMNNTLPEPPSGIKVRENKYVPDASQIIGPFGQSFDERAIKEASKEKE